MKIREALALHHRKYNFGDSPGGYDDRWARVDFGPLTLRFPNFRARSEALRFHDINHIATGYPPVEYKGEMQLAYFEYGNGLGRHWAAWMFDGFALIFALRWPIAAWRAFQRGRNAKQSLFKDFVYDDRLLEKSVDDLRNELGI